METLDFKDEHTDAIADDDAAVAKSDDHAETYPTQVQHRD